MRARFRIRIRLVLFFIIIVAILIITRLYYVQIVDGEAFLQKADRQFASGGGRLFDRGSIYFTKKDGTIISAATLDAGFLVAINPQTLVDPELAYYEIMAVASTTMLSREMFFASAEKKSRVFIEVAHRLSEENGQKLADKKIPGVQVLHERWRKYPGFSLASQSIGIVSYGSGHTLSGRTGLEAKYDNILTRSGESLHINFFSELFSNVGNMLVSPEEINEGDIITTIEPNVQTRLAINLAALNKRYSSIRSGGIIMDPVTGAVIAIENYPSYDGNNLRNIDIARLKNPMVEHIYEFGSIMKPLTVTAALDTNVITPYTTYNDTGCIVVNTRRICNWDQKARGVVAMEEIILQSLNVGSAWIAEELGQEKFRSYFTKLFGQKTEIDLPNEIGAMLRNLHKPQQIGYSTAAFGQGIAITPIQMIRALGAIANKGSLVQPHLVSAIRLNSGIKRKLDWSERILVFSATSTRETTKMMTKLTDEVLAGGKTKIPTMSVATKTGTAQLAKSDGGYYDDRYFHSFVGFFPAFNPRFIILLYTNDPKGVRFASETLNEVFFDLVHYLIDYYEIPPDRGFSDNNRTE